MRRFTVKRACGPLDDLCREWEPIVERGVELAEKACPPSKPVEVVLRDTTDHPSAIARSNPETRQISLSQYHLLALNVRDPVDVARILCHEVDHLELGEKVEQLPYWYTEGRAEYKAKKAFGASYCEIHPEHCRPVKEFLHLYEELRGILGDRLDREMLNSKEPHTVIGKLLRGLR